MALVFEHLIWVKYIMIPSLYEAYVPSILNVLLHLGLTKPKTVTIIIFTLQLKLKLSLLPKVKQVVSGQVRSSLSLSDPKCMIHSLLSTLKSALRRRKRYTHLQMEIMSSRREGCTAKGTNIGQVLLCVRHM